MTFQATIKPAQTKEHREASEKIERWRGQCVSRFAELEQVIAAFVMSSGSSDWEPGFGLGCRIKQLRRVVDGGSGTAGRIANRLDKLEDTIGRRAAIVHGHGNVYIDAEGRWLWDAHVFKQHETVLTAEVFRQEDAENLERQLQHHLQSLCRLLENYAAERQAATGSSPA